MPSFPPMPSSSAVNKATASASGQSTPKRPPSATPMWVTDADADAAAAADVIDADFDDAEAFLGEGFPEEAEGKLPAGALGPELWGARGGKGVWGEVVAGGSEIQELESEDGDGQDGLVWESGEGAGQDRHDVSMVPVLKRNLPQVGDGGRGRWMGGMGVRYRVRSSDTPVQVQLVCSLAHALKDLGGGIGPLSIKLYYRSSTRIATCTCSGGMGGTL